MILFVIVVDGFKRIVDGVIGKSLGQVGEDEVVRCAAEQCDELYG